MQAGAPTTTGASWLLVSIIQHMHMFNQLIPKSEQPYPLYQPLCRCLTTNTGKKIGNRKSVKERSVDSTEACNGANSVEHDWPISIHQTRTGSLTRNVWRHPESPLPIYVVLSVVTCNILSLVLVILQIVEQVYSYNGRPRARPDSSTESYQVKIPANQQKVWM